jgi:hypothetical protein
MLDQNPVRIFSDRDKVRDQLIKYMSYYLELDNIDMSKTSYLSYLVNILSVLTSNLVFYNSSNYRNFFQTKAFDKDAVLSWASMLGYSPELASPATCEVLVSLPCDFDTSLGDISISIPRKFKYYSGKIVFEQVSEVQIDITRLSETDISAVVSEILGVGGKKIVPSRFNSDKSILYFHASTIQETTETQDFIVPDLAPYGFHTIDVNFKGNLNSISVVSSNPNDPTEVERTWTRYSSLFLIPALSTGYSTRLVDNGCQLFFGNDIIGKQPDVGDKISVELSLTEGSAGNVIAGSITKTDKLFITAGSPAKVVPVKLEVINTVPATGGTDFPTIDEIKSKSIANAVANKRLVTGWDFENVDDIVEDIPFRHALSILKRSDIKRNEIALFSDLFFRDVVVPTRNTSWVLDSTSLVDSTSSSGYYKIYSTDTIEIDNEEYYSMFNIDVYPETKECKYYYNVNNLDVAVSINRMYTDTTYILPTFSNFTIVNVEDPLNNYVSITLNYQIIQIPDGETEAFYDTLVGTVYTSFNPIELNMNHDAVNDKFTINIPLIEFPNNSQNIHFKIYNGTFPYCDVQCDVTVKRDLSEFMYSQVEVIPTDVRLYDVPVIKKDYRDSIDNNEFITGVIQKIVNFDVSSYKMLTDFINVKFSNTTGKLTNMQFNPVTVQNVLDVDPIEIPESPIDGDRYIITTTENPWLVAPTCIVSYSESSNSWITERLTNKDIIYMISKNLKYIYNGETISEMVQDIPLNIDVIVWKNDGSNITSQALIRNVKDAIIDNFMAGFGYDKPLYRSQLIKVVQSVAGIKHCEIRSPKHDIFFEYDIYEDFTEQELLDYSPQLVYIDTNSITVEVH